MTQTDEYIFHYIQTKNQIEDIEYKKIISQLIDQKKYSSINIQDEQGNTFLHYAIKNKNDLNLAKKLIIDGADPSIRNKNNESPIYILDRLDNSFDFWDQFLSDYYTNTFNNLKNAHLIFKDLLFNLRILKSSEFNNIDNALNFLSTHNIDSESNKIKIIGYSTRIPFFDRISWYVSETKLHTPRNNSLFLSSLEKQLYFLDNKSNYKKSFDSLLELSFYNNFHFYEILETIGKLNISNDVAFQFPEDVTFKIVEIALSFKDKYCEDIIKKYDTLKKISKFIELNEKLPINGSIQKKKFKLNLSFRTNNFILINIII